MTEEMESYNLYIQAITDDAIGVYEEEPKFGKEQELIWLPKSKIEPLLFNMNDLYEGGLEDLLIPEWLAAEKGLI